MVDAMTIEEFIERLRQNNTGATCDIVIKDAQGRYWTPDLEFSRIDTSGEGPFEWDNDCSNALVICAPAEA